jgi:hypothetical protein
MIEKDYLIDTLTQEIGVLTRREAEARILIPVIDALCETIDKDVVVAAIRRSIVRIAREQGALLADVMGGNTAAHFMRSLDFWTQNNALEIKVHQQTDIDLCFDVTRCRYAEMYTALGAADLGGVLSCNRDFALVEGFHPGAILTRKQTLMQGDPVCDFRYDFSGKK